MDFYVILNGRWVVYECNSPDELPGWVRNINGSFSNREAAEQHARQLNRED